MSHGDEEAVREFWDDVASDWRIQVGREGDVNRRLNSDPVLWSLLGDVAGRRILDAGCGTGYLSRKLSDRGALVTGVDLSAGMIDIARADYPDLDFRRESISELPSIEDSAFDAVVSNYVLMDLPDLDGALAALYRVLRPGGIAVLIFSHPCFPQGRRSESDGGSRATYTWDFPYFEELQCVDPPWKHFRREFIWYHRPLSGYWKAFAAAGFAVDAFEEPRVSPERMAAGPWDPALAKLSRRPYAVAFRLRRPEV